MQRKVFFWFNRGVGSRTRARDKCRGQDRGPEHFRGIINDFTAAHDAKGKPSGPGNSMAVWRLDLSRNGSTADFSAA